MRTNRFLTLAGIVLFAGSIVFTGCKSKAEEEISEEQKTTTEETGSYNGETVKTQFLINISEGVVNNNVRRMPDASVQKSSAIADFLGMQDITIWPFATLNDGITSSTAKLGVVANSDNTALGNISAGALNATNNSKIYNDVQIPLGTQSFLFYARAIGSVVKEQTTIASEVANQFQFGALTPAGLSGTTPEGISFSPVKIYSSSSDLTVANSLVTYLNSILSAEVSSVAWKDYTDNLVIQDLYKEFITLRAGSSESVLATVEDLWNTLKPYAGSDAMAAAIIAKIEATDYATVSGDDITFDASLKGYPENINMPAGSAALTFASDVFALDNETSSRMGAVATGFSQYVYPASLYYFVQSNIKTSDVSKADEYTKSQDWAAILGTYTDGARVQTSTRSVAIESPIQYAVARMDMKIKQNSGSLKDFKDYSVASPDFTVTGVLVGGQKQVDYQFHQVETATAYTVYDQNVQADAKVGTDFGKVNPTLVLESKENEHIHIAVELLNNSDDFYGNEGKLIPKGTKFYLVAELDPTQTGLIMGDATKTQVFQQDFITTVGLTITKLSAAYNTVPDLRVTGLELGFSVNLEWKSGLEFSVEL